MTDAAKRDAAILFGNMAKQHDKGSGHRSYASRSTGCAKTIPQSGTLWVACRMYAMHPEWSYETSSTIRSGLEKQDIAPRRVYPEPDEGKRAILLTRTLRQAQGDRIIQKSLILNKY